MVDTTTQPPPPPPSEYWPPPPPPVEPPSGTRTPPWYRRPQVLLAVLGVVVLVAGVILAVTLRGGSSGSSDNGASWLPQPAAGKATVGGKVTVNGAARANENVTLLAGDKTKTKIETSSDGTFIFPDVEPGSYSIVVSVWVANAHTDTGAGILNMNWDEPCSAAGFDTLNMGATNDTSGATGVIAVASNEGGTGHHSQPFTVAAGDQHAQNVAFVCDMG